ncbi:RNA 3'-terminal phosphate cyclase/enolpyruvatetransferase [Striga asiatica]|uniref:RNA 3'-terminal phosphate cyclase/enolpyruvatetransferase n=1 Tax=Striga asiatica TaxID=4170 RepID=A0A5A7QAY7_STRAF|nr:RNA 3'-terminal phosphate cyclase/enolpyruvatetransferase [Striga asiatica]
MSMTKTRKSDPGGSSYRGYDYKSTTSCIHAPRSTPFLSTARQLVLICPTVVGKVALTSNRHRFCCKGGSFSTWTVALTVSRELVGRLDYIDLRSASYAIEEKSGVKNESITSNLRLDSQSPYQVGMGARAYPHLFSIEDSPEAEGRSIAFRYTLFEKMQYPVKGNRQNQKEGYG